MTMQPDSSIRRAGYAALAALAMACGGSTQATDASMDETPSDGRVADARPDTATGDGGMSDSAVDTGVRDSGVADTGPMDSGPEPCAEEGATRVTECGMCGMGSEQCTGGVWVAGACFGEGECAAGMVQDEMLPMCATQARLCDATCHWLPFEDGAPAGECEAGATRESGDGCAIDEVKTETCSATCAWELTTACHSACGTVRTSPHFAEEVCVPAGNFIRGDDSLTGWDGTGLTPNAHQHEVFMSSYVIDRYHITVARYLACRAAGACAEALDFSQQQRVDDTTHPNTPMLLRESQVIRFCTWDGGRRLPTEAEWEKAARGPSPRTVSYPWGDTWDCSVLPEVSCPGYLTRDRKPPVDAFPASASYYGMENVFGMGEESLSDLYLADYYDEPSSWVNPPGPTAPPADPDIRTARGTTYSTGDRTIVLSRRLWGNRTTAGLGVGRCARSLP